MAIFPSAKWVAAVLEASKKSEVYKAAAKDWEGDFLCIIEGDELFLSDIGRKEVMEGFISLLGTIPAEDRKKYRGTAMGDVFEKKLGMPLDASIKELDANEMLKKLSTVSAEDLKGATLNFWADFWHGSVRNMTAVAPGEHEDAAFKLSGKYSVWKTLVSGKEDAIKLVMSGKVLLKGDMSYLMRHMKAALALTKEVFAGVPID